jgi:hypothetical protein
MSVFFKPLILTGDNNLINQPIFTSLKNLLNQLVTDQAGMVLKYWTGYNSVIKSDRIESSIYPGYVIFILDFCKNIHS